MIGTTNLHEICHSVFKMKFRKYFATVLSVTLSSHVHIAIPCLLVVTLYCVDLLGSEEQACRTVGSTCASVLDWQLYTVLKTLFRALPITLYGGDVGIVGK